MLIARILTGLANPRASFRTEQALAPPEARLLFYAMLGCGLVFVAGLPELIRAAPADAPVEAYVGAQFVARVLFGPLMLYLLAGLTRIVARASGGTGTWAGNRLALFWAILLTSPLMLIAGSLGTVAGGGPVLSSLAWLVALWIWALCLAEAEGFGRPLRVLAGLCVVPVVTFGLFWLAGQGQ